jgi:hypothetical protein
MRNRDQKLGVFDHHLEGLNMRNGRDGVSDQSCDEHRERYLPYRLIGGRIDLPMVDVWHRNWRPGPIGNVCR